MNKKWSMKLCLICVLMSLMLVVSCGKKKITTNEAAVSGGDAVSSTDKTTDDSVNSSDSEQVNEDEEGFGGASGKGSNSGAAFDSANNIYFDYDSSDIQDSQRATLEAKAAWLKKNSKAKITIEGHCDERGTSEYNLALGDRRATRAKKFLEKLGVSGDRMDTVSYGEEKPAVAGHDEEAWSKNRRAYFADK